MTENRLGVEVKVNHKARGDIFGEVSLMFSGPRTASVVAANDASVWVLERSIFRSLTRKAAMEANVLHEVFLNSVPILSSLTVEERIRLAEALEDQVFQPGEVVVEQGDANADRFYIVAKGEAIVTVDAGADHRGVDRENSRKVNHLFRSDFFGEKALLYDQPRDATVTATGTSPLVCLCLNRTVFTDLLGSLEELMVGRRELKPIETRVASACFQRLKLKRGCTAFKLCFQFQLAALHVGARKVAGSGDAAHEGAGGAGAVVGGHSGDPRRALWRRQRRAAGPGRGDGDMRPGTRDPGPRTRNLGPGTRDPGPGTRDPGPETRDPGPGRRGDPPRRGPAASSNACSTLVSRLPWRPMTCRAMSARP